jgi:transcriptional regulator with XRE-family HTH domain
VTTQEDWPSRLTQHIAAQIHYRRKQRKWSARQLSEECATLGLNVPRSTLAKIESGRRASISVAELLVIAQALEIGPAALLPDLTDLAGWDRPAVPAALPPDLLAALRDKAAELSWLVRETAHGQSGQHQPPHPRRTA